MGLRHVIRWETVPVIVLAGWLPLAWAGADLRLGGSYRSYPLSGVAEPTLGYGLVMYGSEGAPFSGYVRAAIDGYTAGSYNSGVAKLEIFPLAILGVRAGGESVQNDRDYSAFDCVNFRCRGRSYRTFIEAELSLGAGPVFAQGKWRRERWTQPDPLAGDFVEPTSGLVMDSAGESQTVYSGVAGLKLGENWAVIAGLRYGEGETGMSQMPFGLLRWRGERFTLGLGGGAFRSELKKREATALGYFTWDIWPSVAIR